jgi:hypothetical protein
MENVSAAIRRVASQRRVSLPERYGHDVRRYVIRNAHGDLNRALLRLKLNDLAGGEAERLCLPGMDVNPTLPHDRTGRVGASCRQPRFATRPSNNMTEGQAHSRAVKESAASKVTEAGVREATSGRTTTGVAGIASHAPPARSALRQKSSKTCSGAKRAPSNHQRCSSHSLKSTARLLDPCGVRGFSAT